MYYCSYKQVHLRGGKFFAGKTGDDKISTEELVISIQKGNVDAFDMLFEKFKNEAVRTAYLITGNRSICEDIAQETFIECYRSIVRLENPKAFKAWFYRILTRIAWKYGRLASLEVPEENITEKADEKNIDMSFERHMQTETNQMLYAEISRLDSRKKEVIILYYFNGLSTKEIASVLNCFEGTVKSRLYAARQELKQGLKTYEADERMWSIC
jgi:RNA polymerase sigma factor (sigma-70 family)